MKTDDIFEALTDIDDRFIESARPIEQLDDSRPMVITPAPRKPRWKTVVPAAACLAAFVTAGAVGGRYLYTRSHSAASENSASGTEFWYPEAAKYRVSADFLVNDYSYTKVLNTQQNRFTVEENYAKSYIKLAIQSDLIIAGQFADDTHQTQDPEQIHSSSLSYWSEQRSDEGSYNYLSVERVLKGDIDVGDHVLIRQETSLNINGANGYTAFAEDLLTPMVKGDSWIYFLKKGEDGIYTPVNGPQGRYPMPDNTNAYMLAADIIKDKIDDFGSFKGSAVTNRDEIYAELLKVFNENTSEIQWISVPDESFTTFAVEEFPDVEFKVSRLGVTADDVDIFEMGEGQLDNLILADLTGDGKRELCATINENGVRRAVVRDFDSGVYYTLSGKREYFLAIEDNVLNVKERMQQNIHLSTTTTTPLTLDMMHRTIPNRGVYLIPIDGEQTFCIEEFSDIPFRVSEDGITVDETDFGYVRHVIFGGVELGKLYLADISGDGKRELIAGANFDGEPVTLVYNFENGETRTLRGSAGYTVAVHDEEGVLCTAEDEMFTFDMLQKADVMDYSKVSLDHHGAFTLPDFEGFRFVVDKSFAYTSFDIGYKHNGSSVVGTHASEVYFCDLDGDGRREIIMNSLNMTADGDQVEAGVRVYDIMEDGVLGEAKYTENVSDRIIEANGRLLFKSQSGIGEIKYSKSDLKPVFISGSYFGDDNLDDDHIIMLTQMFSTQNMYNFEIKDSTLKITYNGDTKFDSGHKLSELYTIYDEANSAIIFVFTNKEDGTVGALKMSNQSVKLYRFEEKITLKPTSAELLIVHEDGTEEPFRFPKVTGAIVENNDLG